MFLSLGGINVILNLDLNPYINKICNVDSINFGIEVKSNLSNYALGGSIIISNFLDAFNEDSLLTGFLGGLSGDRYHIMLQQRGLAHEFITIKDETKTKLHIVDKEKKYIRILDQEPRVTREDAKNFLSLFIELITNSEIICGSSESLPIGLTDEIYFQLITIANENRKKFILSSNGEEFKKGLDAVPYMAVLDKKVLEDITNLELHYENEIVRACNYILHRGIEFVVICISADEFLMLGQEKGYRISNNAIDKNINTSDLRKISAAFALGINRDYDLDMTLRLAGAFNNYDTSENSYEIDASEIKKMMSEVEICPINYI